MNTVLKKSLGKWPAAGWAFCRQHTVAAVGLVAEALLVLWLVVALFAPVGNVVIPVEEFLTTAPAESGLQMEEGGLVIPEQQAADESAEKTGEAMLVLQSASHAVSPGAYLVKVQYGMDSTSPSVQPVVLNLQTANMTNLVQSEGVLLVGGSTTMEGRAWIPFGARVTDLQVQLSVIGSKAVTIQSITLEEQPVYRLIRLLGAVFLLPAQDWLIWQVAAGTASADPVVRRRQKVLLVLGGIALLACLPFFTNFLRTADDLRFHLTRIVNVAQELKNGQFPVRMYTGMLNGYGYATPLYYCDLFLYLPAILYNCMLPLQFCYQIYGVLVTILTVAACYYSMRHICGEEKICLTGTALYVLSAYRLSNMFERAAVGEYTAMIFLPFVLWGIINIYTREKPSLWDTMPLIVGMAGLVMCHVLSMEMVCLFLVVFVLTAAGKTFRAGRVWALVRAALVTVGLGAWFLVPMLHSMMTQDVSVTGRYSTDFQPNGSTLFELLSPVPLQEVSVNGARTVLGLGTLLALVLGCGILWQRKALRLQDGKMLPILGYSVAIGSLAMVFSLQIFPWHVIFSRFENTPIHKILGMTQFPWRYLCIATALFSLAALAALALLQQVNRRRCNQAMAVLLAGVLLYAGAFYIQIGADDTWSGQKYQASVSDNLWVSGGEYLLPGDVDYYYARPQPQQESLLVKWYEKTDGVAHITLENTGDAEASVVLPINDYGNYQAVDAEGKVLPLTTSENSLLVLTVPGGYNGAVSVAYREPMLWRMAELISLVTAVALCVAAMWGRSKKKKSQQLAGNLTGQGR